MRNGHNARLAGLLWIGVMATAASGTAGCAPKAQQTTRPPPPGGSGAGAAAAAGPKTPQETRAALDQGYLALEQKQFNDAIGRADQILSSVSHGAGTAEALYLKGRALEGKNAQGVTADEAKANLQAAREAYIAALQRNPSEPLKSYVHVSLGNVAYFQDDYPTATAQFKTAYEKLQSPELRSWVLYRIGISQQRQGQFDAADKTFAAVAKEHPDTEPARRAREHGGARAFYVQFATFASSQSAQKAAADLRAQGVAATTAAGPEGRAFLRVGPVASYGQAQYYKTRFAEKYPDAVIVP
jgi:TolA-binding protein